MITVYNACDNADLRRNYKDTVKLLAGVLIAAIVALFVVAGFTCFRTKCVLTFCRDVPAPPKSARGPSLWRRTRSLGRADSGGGDANDAPQYELAKTPGADTAI